MSTIIVLLLKQISNMATNWEIGRLKELVEKNHDMPKEEREFWITVAGNPSSAVKHSSAIRSMLALLESREAHNATKEEIELAKLGREKESAELALKAKEREKSAKRESEKSFYTSTIKPVKTKIVGQDAVLAEVRKKLFVTSLLMNSGLNKKPRTFVFAGGSTNGKTEMAIKIGETICGKTLRIQMSNFAADHDASLITGVAPGYQGSTEKTVIERYMESVEGKYCIVLDEIEKAPPKVFRFLLELLDTGFLTLMNGRMLDLRNSIIIFTTNAGARAVENSIGFNISEKSVSTNGNTAATDSGYVMKAVENLFPPETMNRIGRDNVFVFRDLDESDRKKIVSNMVEEALDELSETVKELARGKYDEAFVKNLRKEALRAAHEKLCERSLRELREMVTDSIVLTASSVV